MTKQTLNIGLVALGLLCILTVGVLFIINILKYDIVW